ncbi:MAG: dienelactone hydrolase family protein [Microbacteriaceae bacterium]
MKIDADAVVWSAPESERAGRPLLVLLHGLGSNESDLFGLSSYLPLEPVIASLRAPLAYGGGYAWFEATGDREPAANLATVAVLNWLDEQSFQSVGLLGFSQGGAMSAQLLRHRPEQFSYAVNLSGFVIPAAHAGDDKLAELKPPVFWGFGTADQVINPEFRAYTDAWLPEHTTLTRRIYEGMPHSVSQQEITDVAAFITAQL